jgi:hypothetical protein
MIKQQANKNSSRSISTLIPRKTKPLQADYKKTPIFIIPITEVSESSGKSNRKITPTKRNKMTTPKVKAPTHPLELCDKTPSKPKL